MLITPETYAPRAVFSPSGLSRAQRCLRAWGLRYLLGVKRWEPASWAEACAIEKPAPKKKSKPTPAERAATKAYNSIMRPALGKECHARLEHYFKGGDVDWNDRPGRIVLAGMHFLPHPDECVYVNAEGEITINVAGVDFRGYRDLLVRDKHGVWLLIDHKTTFSFDYFDREKTQRTVKTPEQLRADPQANLYAYAAMKEHGLSSIACRWVYYRTEGAPLALSVDFTITFADAEAIVLQLAREAKCLTLHIRAANDNAHRRLEIVQALETNTAACEDFGGCEYHHSRGGPCEAQASPGARLKQIAEKRKLKAAQPVERKARNMGFRDKVAAGKGGSTPPASDTGAADAPAEGSDAGQAEAPAEGSTAAQPAASTTKRGPRKAASKSTEDGPEISITCGGVVIPLPKSSSIYAQAEAVFAAFYPEV